LTCLRSAFHDLHQQNDHQDQCNSETCIAIFYSEMVSGKTRSSQLPLTADISLSRPVISQEDEQTILELLCRLLQPIGDYRRQHIRPSKGKRRNKRKRNEEEEHATGLNRMFAEEAVPRPQIQDYLTTGFNSIVRSLEATSQISRPVPISQHHSDIQKRPDETAALSAVFVCRSILPRILLSSLPLLAATASLARPQSPPIRLVSLSDSAEVKLAQAMHQARVGFVGIREDAPDAKALLGFVRNAIDPVDVPWLDETASARYLPVQINSTEKVGRSKNKSQMQDRLR